MESYSPRLPIDKNGVPKVNYHPPIPALVATNKENAAVSSVLVFTHNTTEIEVSAIGGPVVGKWAGIVNNGTSVISIAGTSNFDFIVGSGAVRRLVVPQSVQGNAASIQGVNRAEGLYQGVAYIAAGVPASVLTAEF